MRCESCGSTMELSQSDTLDLESRYEEADAIENASTTHDAYEFTCSDCGEDQAQVKFFSMLLKPKGADNEEEVFSFCRDEKIIGIGWGNEKEPDSREEYLRYRREQKKEGDGLNRSIKDFVIWLQPDDIVFLYDKTSSQYYLAQITGEWQCIPNAGLSEDKREEYKQHDITQFRRAEWYPVPRKYLTGDVLSGTPPLRTIQKKDLDEAQAQYLSLLPDEPDIDDNLNREALKDWLRQEAFGKDGDPENIVAPLSSEELETIVVNYVQRRADAVLMQNTTNDDFPDVESLLRTIDDNGRPQTIGTQVKRGNLSNEGDLENFLTNADDLYIYCEGSPDVEGATEVTDREIAEYICYHTAELPPSALLRLSQLYR